MKALRHHGRTDVRLDADHPQTQPGSGRVTADVAACESDIHEYNDTKVLVTA